MDKENIKRWVLISGHDNPSECIDILRNFIVKHLNSSSGHKYEMFTYKPSEAKSPEEYERYMSFRTDLIHDGRCNRHALKVIAYRANELKNIHDGRLQETQEDN